MSTASASKAPINETQPSTAGKGRVDLVKSDFDALVVQKGYDVFLDKAVRCPCRRKGDHQPLSSCKNCGGSGYVYINRYKTKIIIQSMNIDTRFKEWSEERLGTVKMTARDETNLAFMDRVTLIGAETTSSEVLHPYMNDGQMKCKTIYDVSAIEEIFAFVKDDEVLKKLEINADYTFNNNVFTFDPQYIQGWEDFTVSIRYRHLPAFHVIDMVRQTMTTKTKTAGVQEQNIVMPIHAIGRRSHYVLDEQNISGTYLLDNSYDLSGCDATEDKIIDPPTLLRLEHPNSNTVIVNWNDPSTEETNFILERSTGNGIWTQLSVLAPDTVSYTDNSVSVNSTYFYRIATRENTKQSIWAGPIGITTNP